MQQHTYKADNSTLKPDSKSRMSKQKKENKKTNKNPIFQVYFLFTRQTNKMFNENHSFLIFVYKRKAFQLFEANDLFP